MDKILKKFPNTQYLIAVVLIVLMSVVTIVSITYLRPKEDNTILIGLVLGSTGPTIFSILAFMKGQEASSKSEETHLSVNSRMDEYKKNIEALARALGVAEGKKEAEDRADFLSAEAKKP